MDYVGKKINGIIMTEKSISASVALMSPAVSLLTDQEKWVWFTLVAVCV